MTQSVTKGEPLLPRMTADWFNSTLKQDKDHRDGMGISLPREGECYCKVEGATAVSRFNPAAVTNLVSDAGGVERIPIIAGTGMNEFNWVIPQENAQQNGVCLTVVEGITKAYVTQISSAHTSVFYNRATSRLETARDGKAHILVYGGSSAVPSLITVGRQTQCIRIVGKVTGGLNGTITNAVVGTLRGVNMSASFLGSSITAYNIHAFTADPNAIVRAEWVHSQSRWEIYQATCPGSPTVGI